MTALQELLDATNFSDPRVQRRLRQVLAWCDLNLSVDESREVWSSELTGVFGSNANGQRFGSRLRAALLNKTKAHLASDKAKGIKGYAAEYVLNGQAFQVLSAKVEEGEQLDLLEAYPNHKEELTRLEFDYTIKSDRYWHPLQNIRRGQKAEFWKAAGLPHDYDIAAAAPTILLQLAKRANVPAVVVQSVEDYLANKRAFREHVANVGGLSYDDAKGLVNSWFNGARLGMSSHFAVYRNFGPRAVAALKGDQKVRSVRAGAKALWRAIQRGEATVKEVSRGGLTLKVPVRKAKTTRTSKNKWAIYFEQERAVLDVVKDWLTSRGVKFFTEHDGFRTDRKIAIRALESEIKERTGFVLKIENER